MIKGYQCDAYNCNSSVGSIEMYNSSGFIKLNWMGKQYDFCSWDCVLRFGSRYEPVWVKNA